VLTSIPGRSLTTEAEGRSGARAGSTARATLRAEDSVSAVATGGSLVLGLKMATILALVELLFLAEALDWPFPF